MEDKNKEAKEEKKQKESRKVELFFATPLAIEGRGVAFRVDEGRKIKVFGWGEQGRPKLPDEVKEAISRGEPEKYAMVFEAVQPPGKGYWLISKIERVQLLEEEKKKKQQKKDEVQERPQEKPQEKPGFSSQEEDLFLDRTPEGFQIKDADGTVYGTLKPESRLPIELSASAPPPGGKVLVRLVVRRPGPDGSLQKIPLNPPFIVPEKDIKRENGKIKISLVLGIIDGKLQVKSPSTKKTLFSRSIIMKGTNQKKKEVSSEKETPRESSVKAEQEKVVEREEVPEPERKGDDVVDKEYDDVMVSDMKKQEPFIEKNGRGLALDLSKSMEELKQVLGDVSKGVVNHVFDELQGFENARIKLQCLDLAFRAATDFTEKQFQILRMAGVRFLKEGKDPEKVKALMDLHNTVFERNFKAFLNVVQSSIAGEKLSLGGVGLGKGQMEKKIMEKLERAEDVHSHNEGHNDEDPEPSF